MIGTISPRYMNHIPQEKIISGFNNKTSQIRGEFYWDFRICLKASRKIVFSKSQSHPLKVLSSNNKKTKMEFTLDKKCIPNKDFVFTYTTADFELPSSVLGKSDAGSSAMLSFIPKFSHISIDDAYQASVEGKKIETSIEEVKGEYIFLLDRSYSMSEGKI